MKAFKILVCLVIAIALMQCDILQTPYEIYLKSVSDTWDVRYADDYRPADSSTAFIPGAYQVIDYPPDKYWKIWLFADGSIGISNYAGNIIHTWGMYRCEDQKIIYWEFNVPKRWPHQPYTYDRDTLYMVNDSLMWKYYHDRLIRMYDTAKVYFRYNPDVVLPDNPSPLRKYKMMWKDGKKPAKP